MFYHGQSATVSSVNGFETKAACENAARSWFKELRDNVPLTRMQLYKFAQCEPTR